MDIGGPKIGQGRSASVDPRGTRTPAKPNLLEPAPRLGSFLAKRSRGEMRTFVFQHIKAKIRYFASRADQRTGKAWPQ